MNFFDELGEFVRSVQTGKFAFARRIKPFAKRDAILEQLCGFERFAKMLMQRGEVVENCAAVRKCRLQLFKNRNLRPSFRRVRRLRRHAPHFLLPLRLLSVDRP